MFEFSFFFFFFFLLGFFLANRWVAPYVLRVLPILKIFLILNWCEPFFFLIFLCTIGKLWLFCPQQLCKGPSVFFIHFFCVCMCFVIYFSHFLVFNLSLSTWLCMQPSQFLLAWFSWRISRKYIAKYFLPSDYA